MPTVRDLRVFDVGEQHDNRGIAPRFERAATARRHQPSEVVYAAPPWVAPLFALNGKPATFVHSLCLTSARRA